MLRNAKCNRPAMCSLQRQVMTGNDRTGKEASSYATRYKIFIETDVLVRLGAPRISVPLLGVQAMCTLWKRIGRW